MYIYIYICLIFITLFFFITDLQSVYETTQEEMKEEGINCPSNLASEATYINQNFSQQCLKRGDVHKFDNANPFVEEEGEEVASVGYK